MSSFKIVEWHPLARTALRGFAKVAMPSIILNEMVILDSAETLWASTPSKAMIGSDGIAMKDRSGRTRYAPIIKFTSKGNQERIQRRLDRSDAACAS
jgi:hypothetical protein